MGVATATSGDMGSRFRAVFGNRARKRIRTIATCGRMTADFGVMIRCCVEYDRNGFMRAAADLWARRLSVRRAPRPQRASPGDA